MNVSNIYLLSKSRKFSAQLERKKTHVRNGGNEPCPGTDWCRYDKITSSNTKHMPVNLQSFIINKMLTTLNFQLIK